MAAAPTKETVPAQPEANGEPEIQRDSRGWDAELLCMGRILRMLDEHDASAQARIVAYLTARFNAGREP